ncbi:MAG TPA: hypothetical protein VKH37_09940 [Ferruginibacter sp.]|nr:hypothetical protein [Ferruginibacter sp.]
MKKIIKRFIIGLSLFTLSAIGCNKNSDRLNGTALNQPYLRLAP